MDSVFESIRTRGKNVTEWVQAMKIKKAVTEPDFCYRIKEDNPKKLTQMTGENHLRGACSGFDPRRTFALSVQAQSIS